MEYINDGKPVEKPPPPPSAPVNTSTPGIALNRNHNHVRLRPASPASVRPEKIRVRGIDAAGKEW